METQEEQMQIIIAKDAETMREQLELARSEGFTVVTVGQPVEKRGDNLALAAAVNHVAIIKRPAPTVEPQE